MRIPPIQTYFAGSGNGDDRPKLRVVPDVTGDSPRDEVVPSSGRSRFSDLPSKSPLGPEELIYAIIQAFADICLKRHDDDTGYRLNQFKHRDAGARNVANILFTALETGQFTLSEIGFNDAQFIQVLKDEILLIGNDQIRAAYESSPELFMQDLQQLLNAAMLPFGEALTVKLDQLALKART